MESTPFSISSFDYFKIISMQHINYFLLAAGVSTCMLTILAGVYDLRYILLALILIFLVAPFYVFHIYINYMLTKQAALSISNKRVEINIGKNITETFIPVNDDDNQSLPRKTQSWLWTDINSFDHTKRFMIFTFSSTNNYKLIIPHNSINDFSIINQIYQELNLLN